MIFRVQQLRYTFVARSPVVFPPGKAGNVFRGALGTVLHETPMYGQVFAPRAESGPSGLADPPRPFVIRASALDGRRFGPGQRFSLEVNLFASGMEEYFTRAWRKLGDEGLGPAQGRFVVEEKSTANVEIDLARMTPAMRLRIEFLSPTEIKGASEPSFAVLFARLRDRISTLRSLYQGSPLEIDFRAMGERAAAVRCLARQLEWESVERRSSRTGQTHPLGGFTGWAEYEGELAEFVPFLEAGRYTGVGRQTVWGKGALLPLLLS